MPTALSKEGSVIREKFAAEYLEEFARVLHGTECTGKAGAKPTLTEGIVKATAMLRRRAAPRKRIFFIGNGASAAIASHQATDYTKNGGMRAAAFNDSSLLTCFSNDFGYEHVFEKAVELHADKGDCLIAISSSGRSENILRAVRSASSKGLDVISLSGFAPGNPLRRTGDLNFYVPSSKYNHVEAAHQLLLSCILDTAISAACSTFKKKAR